MEGRGGAAVPGTRKGPLSRTPTPCQQTAPGARVPRLSPMHLQALTAPRVASPHSRRLEPPQTPETSDPSCSRAPRPLLLPAAARPAPAQRPGALSWALASRVWARTVQTPRGPSTLRAPRLCTPEGAGAPLRASLPSALGVSDRPSPALTCAPSPAPPGCGARAWEPRLWHPGTCRRGGSRLPLARSGEVGDGEGREGQTGARSLEAKARQERMGGAPQ